MGSGITLQKWNKVYYKSNMSLKNRGILLKETNGNISSQEGGLLGYSCSINKSCRKCSDAIRINGGSFSSRCSYLKKLDLAWLHWKFKTERWKIPWK